MIVFLRSYGLALCSSVLLAWAFPTFHWYFLAWVALVPLFWSCAQRSLRVSAARFFVAGWAFHAIVLQWLYANMFWEGGWAIVGAQGVCIIMAVYWAILGALWPWLNARFNDGRAALMFAMAWAAMEWVQSWMFTGFCWAALGYSQGPDIWFSQLASFGGVTLLSAILVGVNASIATALHAGRGAWKPLAQALFAVLVAHGVGLLLYGPDRTNESDYSVGLYQSNYPQHMKWDPDFQDTMLEMALVQSHAIVSAEPADLVVWPEALVMSEFREPAILEQLQSFAAATGVPLFSGVVRTDDENGKHYNSSALIHTDGRYETYDKVHLAPFGEYIPLEEYLGIARNFGAQGGMAAGASQVVMEAGGRKFGPLICFEVLFGPLASECRALGADFLVVITNLAWFGNSNILGQELELARFRAIENRLPLVQCANSGVSAVIDPFGRVQIIDGQVTSRGYAVTREAPSADFAKVQRRVGVLTVPPSARMVLPGSVDWFGPIVFVLTVAGLLAARLVDRTHKTALAEAEA